MCLKIEIHSFLSFLLPLIQQAQTQENPKQRREPTRVKEMDVRISFIYLIMSNFLAKTQ